MCKDVQLTKVIYLVPCAFKKFRAVNDDRKAAPGAVRVEREFRAASAGRHGR